MTAPVQPSNVRLIRPSERLVDAADVWDRAVSRVAHGCDGDQDCPCSGDCSEHVSGGVPCVVCAAAMRDQELDARTDVVRAITAAGLAPDVATVLIERAAR